MERIEITIIRNLIHNEDFSRKVIPFLEPSYFERRSDKILFEEISSFIVKYGCSVTIEALNIEVENRSDVTDDEVKEIKRKILKTAKVYETQKKEKNFKEYENTKLD